MTYACDLNQCHRAWLGAGKSGGKKDGEPIIVVEDFMDELGATRARRRLPPSKHRAAAEPHPLCCAHVGCKRCAGLQRSEAGGSLFAARVFEMMDDDKSGALVRWRR